MIKRTLITPMMTFRALTGALNGVPPRNFSVFCRSSSRPCQAVRIAFLVDGSCGGQFASRVVGGGVVDVTRLEPGATAAADVAVGKRVVTGREIHGDGILLLPIPVCMLLVETAGSCG